MPSSIVNPDFQRRRLETILFGTMQPKPCAKAVEINKVSNPPCSFAAQLRCSLVADRGGYAPHSRLAGRQNPGGILLPLFISTALTREGRVPRAPDFNW